MTRPSRLPKWGDDSTFTSGPNSGDPVRVEPTDGTRAQGIVPGETLKSEYINDELHLRTQWLRFIDEEVGGFYGDGSLGDVAISSNTTANADVYAANLEISPGIALNMGAYKLFVRGTLTIGAGGRVHRNGNNATGVTGAGGLDPGTLRGAPNGGAGGSGAAAGGSGGAGSNDGLGGNGGAGGSVGEGLFAGGSGGAVTTPTIGEGNAPRTAPAIIRGAAVGMDGSQNILETPIRGGAGGGGGACNTAGETGGGGGGGGGVLMIAARFIAGTGTIEARGGNGDNGSGGESGGGGGGGGGLVLLVTRVDVDGDGIVGGPAIDVSGGAPGNGTGDGENGTPGDVGRVIWVRA